MNGNNITNLGQKAIVLWRLTRLFFQNRRGFQAIVQVRREKLTYLGTAALLDLLERVTQVEAAGRKGILIEAGSALGGSAMVMATAKSEQRPFYLYDAFGMIPPPSTKDGDDAHGRYGLIKSGKAVGISGEKYYGYQKDLLTLVKQSFENFGFSLTEENLHLVQGLYEDSLHPDAPVALAHLDCDWHDSVLVCLQRIEPLLVPGGVLVIDDYDAWSGCRAAVDAYFADRQGEFDFIWKSRLHIIKKQPAV